MEIFENQLFRDKNLAVDGGRFVNCRFQNVGIVFHAGQVPEFENCIFENCKLLYAREAQRVMEFLNMLASNYGEEFREDIEKFWIVITKGKYHELDVDILDIDD